MYAIHLLFGRGRTLIRRRSAIEWKERAPDCPCTRRCLSCSLCYGIYMFWYYYCPLLHSYIGNTRMARWISRPRPFAGETCLRPARWATEYTKRVCSCEIFFAPSFAIWDVSTLKCGCGKQNRRCTCVRRIFILEKSEWIQSKFWFLIIMNFSLTPKLK